METRPILNNKENTVSTKADFPWELVYFEEYKTKAEAMKESLSSKDKRIKLYWKKIINGII